jgi:hypothetical protein
MELKFEDLFGTVGSDVTAVFEFEFAFVLELESLAASFATSGYPTVT